MIEDIELRKLLDSRGNATVEAEVYTSLSVGRFSAPSGQAPESMKLFPSLERAWTGA